MRIFIYFLCSVLPIMAFAQDQLSVRDSSSVIQDKNIIISDTVNVVSKSQLPNDTITTEEVKLFQDTVSIVETQKKKSFWDKFKDYFKDSNKEKKNKKFDFSIIGGPHYASDTKLGLGLVGAGLYKMDRSDTILPPSNVSLFGDVSTVGFYLIGIRGNNIFPKDKYRLNYSLYIFSFPSYYWGIGYENGNNDDNKSKLKRMQAKIKAEFLFKLTDNLYLGPSLVWDYLHGKEIEKPELLNGMDLITRNYGFGFTLSYDSRDFLTNASKGVYFCLNQTFRPKFLWNDYAFSTTDLRVSYYKSVWKGGIIAGELKGQFNFGDPSWGMMALLGDSNSMRGYYEGRYRDKHKLEAQIELRQHVWRRNGIAVWVGTGTVFHDKHSFGHFLPNYGIGYRWEFKKRVNVRLDLGFGKSGQTGFIFNINEAF